MPVFDESENLEGETPHLTLPVLQDCGLRVFVATEQEEEETQMEVKIDSTYSRCSV